MRYGYFDNNAKEYVIIRPDTPTPWINYLGNGGYSGIISNTAGGMSFHKDPNYRRVTRYKFNNLPVDRPGRYVYIRDMDSNEYWSPSWQPVMKELDEYECRHGMGYTIIKGTYSGITSQTTYYVPLNKDYEVWKMKIMNNSPRTRDLKLFTYVEFSYYNAMPDILCDWPRMLFSAQYRDGMIIFDPVSQFDPLIIYFGTNLEVEGYDCSLEKYIGPYRSESNPIVVENGKCTDSDMISDNAVGGLCCPLKLEAGEERTVVFVLGVSESKESAYTDAKKALDIDEIDKDFIELKKSWEAYMSKMRFHTPDQDVNTMLNIWNQYQCKTTFDWSRFISFYERGVDRGIGFRDSVQDTLGVMYTVPEQAKERLKELLSIQLKRGDAMSVYYPATKTAMGGGRSDDHLWTVFSVCTYIKETGDKEFLNEIVPFYDEGEGTVLEHLENGIKFTMEHLGSHGIPLWLTSDWNDSMQAINLKGGAESVFVFFQLAHAVKELIELYRHYGYEERLKWANDIYDYCKSKLDTVWDGKWFIRAFNSKGEKVGTDEDPFNKIFLNPQSWAVMSGLPSREKAITAFDSVREYLVTELGIIINYPAADFFDPERKGYIPFPPGSRENGGIFFHANTWAIIAETMLGRNDYAFEYYRNMLPGRRNDIADLCRVEPYVYCQNMLGKEHPRFGAGYNSWLSGTAAWIFFAASQYIMGIRPDYDGLIIDPCIPSEWEYADVERVFRGVRFNISIKNKSGRAERVSKLIVDGNAIEGNKIHTDYFKYKKLVYVIAEI